MSTSPALLIGCARDGAREPRILEALGNLGDFLGGIAVIATLVYLAVQIRQNTGALRAQSRLQIVQSFREYNRHFIRDPELDEVFLAGIRSYPDVAQPARGRFFNLLMDQALHFQGALALHDSGALDEGTYRAYLDHFAMMLATPGGAAFWEHTRDAYPEHMVRAVDERLARGGLPDFLAHPFWD